MHCTAQSLYRTECTLSGQLLDMQPNAQISMNSGTICTQPPYTLTTLYLPLAILAWCALCCSLHIVVLAWGAVNTLSVVPPRAPRLMPQIPRRKPELLPLQSSFFASACFRAHFAFELIFSFAFDRNILIGSCFNTVDLNPEIELWAPSCFWDNNLKVCSMTQSPSSIIFGAEIILQSSKPFWNFLLSLLLPP